MSLNIDVRICWGIPIPHEMMLKIVIESVKDNRLIDASLLSEHLGVNVARSQMCGSLSMWVFPVSEVKSVFKDNDISGATLDVAPDFSIVAQVQKIGEQYGFPNLTVKPVTMVDTNYRMLTM